MKKRPYISKRLIIFSSLFLIFVPGCRKDDPDIVKDIDGNVYHAVTIGTQVWFMENLKTTRYKDGTPIPLITGNVEWSTLTTQGFCWYNNDKAAYGNTYGALYNWYAAAKGKLCPTGWHIPSDDEWTILIDFLGGENVAGGKLKSTRTAADAHPRWDSPNTEATNEYGFSALPGGYRSRVDGVFDAVGIFGGWWSRTEDAATAAWTRSIYYNGALVYRYNDAKREAISVRSIKD